MITPKTLKGTRDFSQADMAKRNYVRDTIRGVFESFGYDPIETPAIEYAETILGKYGEEGDKLTYSFEDNGGRKIALRYDQTVPFARYFAANYGALTIPFKRYEINRVWRADKPQKGRYREFYQCDVDIIGTESIVAEVELAKIVYTSFKKLNIQKFCIKINDRSLLNDVLEKAEISNEDRVKCIRVIDKLDKIGYAKIVDELKDLGLMDSQIKILDILFKTEGTNREKIQQFNGFATKNIIEFLDYIEGTDLENYISFEPTLARGMDYYTGIIFETVIPETGLGSVAGGGRYANLCAAFTKQQFSGVGIGIGFDRIIDALEILDLFQNTKTNAEVLVTLFDEKLKTETLKIADSLREAGINTEQYFQTDKLSKQLKYADRRGVGFVVIYGFDEKENESVMLKNMQSGKTKTIPLNKITEIVKEVKK
jgi:histidyl-tRNA synthetase